MHVSGMTDLVARHLEHTDPGKVTHVPREHNRDNMDLLTELRSHTLYHAEDRYYHGFVGKITLLS